MLPALAMLVKALQGRGFPHTVIENRLPASTARSSRDNRALALNAAEACVHDP